VGFDSATALVRAWRAGYVYLLLDGYDEIATTGWLSQSNDLRQIRRRSVELIRKFIDQTPTGAGVMLAGRRHFFDTSDEMSSALGLAGKSPLVINTDEFTEGQVATYLERFGVGTALPSWLPSRPLLVAYLAAAGSLGDLAATKASVGADEGWDLLLERICERESSMEVGVDGKTVRRILERLATFARGKASGVGPIFPSDLVNAFQQVCGYVPDEGSYLLLQRMPGLGVQNTIDGSRYLIDDALTDAARAGDVVRYLQSYDSEEVLAATSGSLSPLGEVGLGVAVFMSERSGIQQAQAFVAAKRLQDKGSSDAFVFDAASLATRLEGSSAAPKLGIRELAIDELVYDDLTTDLSAISFSDCMIAVLDLSEYDGSVPIPHFSRTFFGTVTGAGSKSALPDDHFDNCTFEQFDNSAKTTKGILSTPGLTPRQKVLLTVLKKIYAQAGSSRKESALKRGLDKQHQAFVGAVLDYLVTEGLTVPGKAGNNLLYYPVRGTGSRVRKMLEAGAGSDDPLLRNLA